MSFTYDFDTNPQLSTVRLMISDTDAMNPVFQDAEISAAIQFTGSPALYASGQRFVTANQYTSNASVFSLRRAAAMLIDCLASNSAKLAIVEQILDVKLAGKNGTDALHAIAQALRDEDDALGQFAIAEQIQNGWQLRERYWAMVQRQSGGA